MIIKCQTASGTNLGSLNKSNMNYIKKEEYLSLLEQLNKRNQDEEVYIKAIEVYIFVIYYSPLKNRIET